METIRARTALGPDDSARTLGQKTSIAIHHGPPMCRTELRSGCWLFSARGEGDATRFPVGGGFFVRWLGVASLAVGALLASARWLVLLVRSAAFLAALVLGLGGRSVRSVGCLASGSVGARGPAAGALAVVGRRSGWSVWRAVFASSGVVPVLCLGSGSIVRLSFPVALLGLVG